MASTYTIVNLMPWAIARVLQSYCRCDTLEQREAFRISERTILPGSPRGYRRYFNPSRSSFEALKRSCVGR